MTGSPGGQAGVTDVQTVTYKYNVSPSHKTYHADGMYGGNNTTNKLVISFYSERAPTPIQGELTVVGSTPTGPETITASKFIAERDIDVSVSMDLNLALSFYTWLEEKVGSMSIASGMDKEELAKTLEVLRGGKSAL